MSERRPFRAGDIVQDTAVGGREWIVDLDESATVSFAVTSRVDEERRLVFGLPTSSRFALSTAASDEGRIARLRKVAAEHAGFRARIAQALLDAEPKPRLTLADVVANPPSGWTFVWHDDDGYWALGWGPIAPTTEECKAVIHVGEDGKLHFCAVAEDLDKDMARHAHRAVADLLDVLAEVT